MIRKMETTRYIPTGSTPIEHPGGAGVVYSYGDGKPAAIAYAGKSTKKAWHFIFKTQAQRQAHIDSFFASLDRRATAKQERAAIRREPHNLKVGDIIVNSWGYDQTNIDFYQVTRATDHFVWLRGIGGDLTETGFMSGRTSPRAGAFLKDSRERQHRVTMYGEGERAEASVCFPFGCGRKWTGREESCSWYA